MRAFSWVRHFLMAAAICGAGSTASNGQDFFVHNFGAGDGGFTVTNGVGAGIPAGPWTYSASSGSWSATGGEGVVNSVLTSPVIDITTAGGVAVVFNHRYFFEDDGTTRWDAGQVQYSVNGSAFAPIVAQSFIFGGYPTDRLIGGNSPPLAGQYAFNGKSDGYDSSSPTTSIASLAGFNAGDQLTVRFVGAWDEGYVEPGINWELYDLTVSADPNPIVLPPAGKHELLFEAYTGLSNSISLADLKSSPNFPNNPDMISVVTAAQIPVNTMDNYGARLSGYFTPDETGIYDFYMASDDQGELYLSTDADPANKALIASEPEWNANNQYATTDRRNPAAPENRSTTLFPDGIVLEAGKSYYIEGLMKEGGGGDNLSFTAALRVDPLTPAPIPTASLGSPLCNCGAIDLGQLSLSPVAIPEPTSVALVLCGLAGLAVRRRR